MEKQTKNIITRKWVENELRFYNTADMKYLSLTGLIALVACLLLGGIPIAGVWFELPGFLWVKILFSCVYGGALLIVIVRMTKDAFIAFLQRNALRKGNFDIVVREVQYKLEKPVGASRHYHMGKFLCFEEFGDVQTTNDEYDMTSVGDAFYLVVYRMRKPKVRLWYPLKLYELKKD